MPDDTDEPTERLEPIAYLSRSENRLQVLEALTETITKPGLDMPGYEPRELREVTGASEATVSRILNEFDERGWAERDAEGEYTATPLGQSIAIEFTPLIDSMEAIQHLGDAVALLPLNELTISLQHFSDATVREPKGPAISEIHRWVQDWVTGTSGHYELVYTLAPVGGDAERWEDHLDRVADGEVDFVRIMPRSVREYGVEHGLVDGRFLKGGGRVFMYDEHIPCNLMVYDETVVIENSQVQGLRDGTVIESQNGVVREWALDVIDRYRAESEEVTVEDPPE